MAEEDFELVYLTLEDTLELYAAIIGETNDQAAAVLRSRSGLEGALARPAAHANYQDADLALQAAVLAHGIAESQAFLDGNKRLALIAMLTFLEANSYQIAATTQNSPTGSSGSAAASRRTSSPRASVPS